MDPVQTALGTVCMAKLVIYAGGDIFRCILFEATQVSSAANIEKSIHTYQGPKLFENTCLDEVRSLLCFGIQR